MKKYGFLAIAVLAIALICLCLPVFAAEETTQNDNQKIREIVNTIDGVGDSRAFQACRRKNQGSISSVYKRKAYDIA